MKNFLLFIFIFIGFVVISFSYKNNEAKVLFVGDMFFDRHIRQVAQSKGGDYIFSCVDNFLRDSDLVVGNLEGPITDNLSKSLGSEIGSPDNFVFTFPSTTAELLAKYNIKLVNLGNNHIGNFGTEGIFSTKRYLNSAGVKYFGGLGENLLLQIGEPIYRAKLGSNEVSFVSYNQFGGESAEKVAKKISNEKENGRVVFVYAHWGEEYVEPSKNIKDIAALFAKSGATLIVGSHPHVVLSSEKIGATTVYYSLGNFIFDQYWNEDVSMGLVLELNISGKPQNWNIIEHKVSILRDGRTCLLD